MAQFYNLHFKNCDRILDNKGHYKAKNKHFNDSRIFSSKREMEIMPVAYFLSVATEQSEGKEKQV